MKYSVKKYKSHTPRKCVDCKEILTKENWYKSYGEIYSRCNPCKKVYFKKLRDKKRKRINNNQLW